MKRKESWKKAVLILGIALVGSGIGGKGIAPVSVYAEPEYNPLEEDIKIPSEDYNEIKDFCLKHEIDTELNKQVTLVYSFAEFIAKIKLSEELGINLTDENGKLNQIFYIDNEEFKDKFGYSVEELINKYNLDDKSKLR